MTIESVIPIEDAVAPFGMVTETGRRLAPSQEEIAQLAYQLYESRGRQDGHEIEDWLRAEQILVRHYA